MPSPPRATEEPSPATPDDATHAGVRGELRDFLRAQEQRRKQVPRALLVGVIAGFVATTFRWGLALMERCRDDLLVHAHTLGAWGFILPVVFGAVLGGFAVWLVRRVAPE